MQSNIDHFNCVFNYFHSAQSTQHTIYTYSVWVLESYASCVVVVVAVIAVVWSSTFIFGVDCYTICWCIVVFCWAALKLGWNVCVTNEIEGQMQWDNENKSFLLSSGNSFRLWFLPFFFPHFCRWPLGDSYFLFSLLRTFLLLTLQFQNLIANRNA